MDTEGATDYAETIDVREIDGEPFGDITAALDRLGGGDALLLISSFEPVPLYGVLSQRGFTCERRQVGSDEWRVEIRPDPKA